MKLTRSRGLGNIFVSCCSSQPRLLSFVRLEVRKVFGADLCEPELSVLMRWPVVSACLEVDETVTLEVVGWEDFVERVTPENLTCVNPFLPPYVYGFHFDLSRTPKIKIIVKSASLHTCCVCHFFVPLESFLDMFDLFQERIARFRFFEHLQKVSIVFSSCRQWTS